MWGHLLQGAFHLFGYLIDRPESVPGHTDGEWEARRMGEASSLKLSLATKEKELGPDHLELAHPLMALAVHHATYGEWEAAMALHARTAKLLLREGRVPQGFPLERALTALGTHYVDGTRLDVAKVGEVVRFLVANQGHVQALGLLEHLLTRETEQPLGERDRAALLREVGRVLGGAGRPREAEAALWQALEVLRKVEAPDHPAVRALMDDLAGLAGQERQPSEAEKAVDKILLEKRAVVIFGSIDEPAASRIVSQMRRLRDQQPDADVNLYLRSPGGDEPAVLALLEELMRHGDKVSTTSVGYLKGFAGVILAAGAPGKRSVVAGTAIAMSAPVLTLDVERARAKALAHRDELIAAATRGVVRHFSSTNFLISAEDAVAKGLADRVVPPVEWLRFDDDGAPAQATRPPAPQPRESRRRCPSCDGLFEDEKYCPVCGVTL